jgi:6-phosphogluconolactonase
MTVGIALPGTVDVADTPGDVAEHVATWLIAESNSAIALRGKFSIALAGGTTPKQLYRRLNSEPRSGEIAWRHWDFYFGDERACPPDDERSNYAMAKHALFVPAGIDDGQVHRMHAENEDMAQAANSYEQALIDGVGDEDAVPRLDCVLLGVGENGHTASLFPDDPATLVEDRWCTTARADYEPYDRLTLTFPAINAARAVAFMVTGAAKFAALQDVIRGVAPAAKVKPDHGILHWFLDSGADSGSSNQASSNT